MLMITEPNKELKLLAGTAFEFARKELAPEREENDKFPFGPFWDTVLQKAFDIDFFHTTLAEECDGIGQGMTALCTLFENLCQEDSSLAGIILTNSAAQEIMTAAGNMEELQKVTAGKTIKDFLIAFPAFNNPSEVKHLARAGKDGSTYSISGSLEYVVLGGLAGHGLVPARVNGQDGYCFFLVDLADSGVSKSEPVFSLGLHACPAVDLAFDNVPGTLVGTENEGHIYFEKMSDKLHVAAAAMSCGIMKGSFKEALDYSRERFQGGREIINWSEVKMILANMAVKVKNAEMIINAACRAVDSQTSGWEACSRAAAIHVQGLACDLTTDGIQVLGGVGYMKDFGQEKRFRDAKHIQAFLGIAPMKKIKYIQNMI